MLTGTQNPTLCTDNTRYGGWTLFTEADGEILYDRFAVHDGSGEVQTICFDPEEVISPVTFRLWVEIGCPQHNTLAPERRFWTSRDILVAHRINTANKLGIIDPEALIAPTDAVFRWYHFVGLAAAMIIASLFIR